MSKAEERAFERYGITRGDDTQETSGIEMQRASDFIEGYHNAEKDLELTWKDIEKICLIAKESHKFYGFWSEIVYDDILKRFKERNKK